MNRLKKDAAITTKQDANRHMSSFGREITVVLTVKFLLLGFLWWLLFAGKKLPLNVEHVADKLLGGGQTVFSSANTRRNPK